MRALVLYTARVPAGYVARRLAVAMSVLWLCAAATVVYATEKRSKPLWELGLAGGAALIPDYPASDENHPVGIVLPYLVYRGKIFRAGDDGIARGRFLRGDRHEFDVSLSGSFPTNSDHNNARRGMPNLDFLIEVGARLKVTLIEVGQQGEIGLELPLRTVFSISLDAVGYRGVVFHPKLVYRHRNFLNTHTQLKLSGGPIFATEELMDYFYDVAPQFATASRRAFDADAGYLGTRFSLFLRRHVARRLSLFSAIQVGYFEGATNNDSPLFRSKVNVGVGFGFIWSIYQSKRHITE